MIYKICRYLMKDETNIPDINAIGNLKNDIQFIYKKVQICITKNADNFIFFLSGLYQHT